MVEILPSQVQKQIRKMTESFEKQLTELYKWSNCDEYEPQAVEIEDRMRKWVRQIGEDVQALVVGGMDRNRRKGKRPCPECGLEVYWKGYELRN